VTVQIRIECDQLGCGCGFMGRLGGSLKQVERQAILRGFECRDGHHYCSQHVTDEWQKAREQANKQFFDDLWRQLGFEDEL
jgi:hypothetical protein